MQRGAPRGSLSSSLHPSDRSPPLLSFVRSFVRPSNPYETHEPRGDRQRRVTDGRTHRWIDRTIYRVVCALFLLPPSLSLSRTLSAPHRTRTVLHPSSFSLTLLVFRASRYHRDYTRRGKKRGGGGEGAPRPPRALATSVGLFAVPFVSLFMKLRQSG